MKVFTRDDNRALVRRGLRDKSLTTILHGIHCDEVGPAVLLQALALADPDAIVLGEGARWLGWRADKPVKQLLVASQRRLNSRYVTTVRRRIPFEFVCDNGTTRFTSPEYTAVDLIPSHGGDILDEVLREAAPVMRSRCLANMWEAMASMPRRRGNELRRQILTDSRDEPWSEAERRCHRLLREAGITGWRTNVDVRAGDRTWSVDLVFAAEQVAVEVDGWKYHRSKEAFKRDREKTNALTASGWLVLRVTWDQLDQLLGWLRPVLGFRR
ncbi:DUF559 domain-containing protein [Naumannella sp. ID2617S]|nr:DUF559 domain-containing protein [Naumannella sp. ID2617S]